MTRRPLQVFKTEERGYGVRCTRKLDPGTFICAYLGEVACDRWGARCVFVCVWWGCVCGGGGGGALVAWNGH